MILNAIPAGQISAVNSRSHEGKELALFSVAVLGTTTVFAVALSLLHISNDWAYNSLMFVPGIWAAVLLTRNRSWSGVGWRAGTPAGCLYGVGLPCLLLAVTLAAAMALGFAHPGPGRPLIKVVSAFAFYTAVSIPFAFGEELGWRGWAQGAFVREFGLLRGLLLLGLLWGFWHSPIYYCMKSFPAHPFLGSFVMTPLDNVLAVVPMAWLYLRARTIWVPVFTHAFADILFAFGDKIYPKSNETGYWFLLEAGQLVLSLFLYLDLRRRQRLGKI